MSRKDDDGPPTWVIVLGVFAVFSVLIDKAFKTRRRAQVSMISFFVIVFGLYFIWGRPQQQREAREQVAFRAIQEQRKEQLRLTRAATALDESLIALEEMVAIGLWTQFIDQHKDRVGHREIGQFLAAASDGSSILALKPAEHSTSKLLDQEALAKLLYLQRDRDRLWTFEATRYARKYGEPSYATFLTGTASPGLGAIMERARGADRTALAAIAADLTHQYEAYRRQAHVRQLEPELKQAVTKKLLRMLQKAPTLSGGEARDLILAEIGDLTPYRTLKRSVPDYSAETLVSECVAARAGPSI